MIIEKTSAEVLLVTNFNECCKLGIGNELSDILLAAGNSHHTVSGREQALVRIRDGSYRVVCISSSELDLGSERMPPQRYLDMAGNPTADIMGYRKNAAMLEVAGAAIERGLGVVVLDEDDNLSATGSLMQLGAVSLSILATNARDTYDELARLLR